jgi:ribosome biogenesis GTPase A
MEYARTCQGCGAVLHDEHPTREGYVPPSVFARSHDGAPITCQRCFRLVHYHKPSTVVASSEAFSTMLHDVGQQSGLVVHVVDIADCEATWIDALPRFVGERPIVLVANKMDVLPRGTSLTRMRDRVWQFARAQSWRVSDVHVVSAVQRIGTASLAQALARHARVFFVGATNVGKSTLVNALTAGVTDHRLTVSAMPKTTLQAVHVALPDARTYVDTPGIVYGRRLIERVPHAHVLRMRGEMRPVTLPLRSGQALHIGDYVCCEAVSPVPSITCYVAYTVSVRRQKQRSTHVAPLVDEAHGGEDVSWKPVRRRVTMPARAVIDIAIGGLGWLCVHADDQAVALDVWTPPGILVVDRPPWIGGKST